MDLIIIRLVYYYYYSTRKLFIYIIFSCMWTELRFDFVYRDLLLLFCHYRTESEREFRDLCQVLLGSWNAGRYNGLASWLGWGDKEWTQIFCGETSWKTATRRPTWNFDDNTKMDVKDIGFLLILFVGVFLFVVCSLWYIPSYRNRLLPFAKHLALRVLRSKQHIRQQYTHS